MSKDKMTCQKAIQQWETENQQSAQEAEVIKLNFMVPPIEKLDVGQLNQLTKCKQLALSSNCIEKMINLPQLRNLEILSLGRNQIKKISGLEEIGSTLKELWISYNLIEKLDGLNHCQKLQTLYISNNKIKNWDEIDKLKELPELANTNFIGNPLYDQIEKEQYLFVLKRLPQLKNVDGKIVDANIQDKVKSLPDQ
ncbi:hypothetical protein PPERSA_04001 [Pseudocohnilembus persalinus]|uniref:Dynein axonemal light chain 1 n=1 Tax=Pseudocohnilembus persalinus TaxID=266149 RepID=A0A0V0QKM5_PSEPJ|nr:hypothetical protein PPERSA_04001 [Pseudocohnilembus persalinus]|eukprot:KRX02798.1 hypothetical protein PPERSA_04001 [Pseudocohnilembus persalinus]